MSKITVFQDKVLIKPEPKKEKTNSGIIIPNSHEESQLFGTVVSTGTGTQYEEMLLKKDDRVLYSAHSGVTFTEDKQSYVIIRQSDVIFKYDK